MSDLGADATSYADYWKTLGTVDGKWLGLPFKADPKTLIWYSPITFKAYGYTVPTTCEELHSLQSGMGELPAGVGKFILYLNRMGLRILPVGITEDRGQLSVRFGEPYDFALTDAEGDIDEHARAIIQDRISRLLAQ